MANALFINGIYPHVLAQIIEDQNSRGGGVSYLQPHTSGVIRPLRDGHPSLQAPMRLYASTSDNLSNVCYTADIIGWEDKRHLSTRRRQVIKKHFRDFQSGELDLFEGNQLSGKDSVNLITIQNLTKLNSFYSTCVLRKTSDNLPLKRRTRPGGSSEVYDLGDLLSLSSSTQSQIDSDLEAELAVSRALSDKELAARLLIAPKIPERIQIISADFRRNADVIVAVLRRANGTCERCSANAPFIRRSDGSPFLEVHHSTPLSEGGEDTVKNAVALCPNCHREVHYG